jgi:hypothetical protein
MYDFFFFRSNRTFRKRRNWLQIPAKGKKKHCVRYAHIKIDRNIWFS